MTDVIMTEKKRVCVTDLYLNLASLERDGNITTHAPHFRKRTLKKYAAICLFFNKAPPAAAARKPRRESISYILN